MVDANEIRRHVLDDAVELIATLKLLWPLHEDLEEGIVENSRKLSANFLLGLLQRNLVLVVCRLHERADKGRDGHTASIAGWLKAIHECSHRNRPDTQTGYTCRNARSETSSPTYPKDIQIKEFEARGLLVRHDCPEPLGLSCSRRQFSELLNGYLAISCEMAIRR